jgi:tetratricopeptide (TPR) repeat protein
MPDEGAEFVPSADEVRAALDRIVASEPFRPSAQLQAFLRFVVDSTLKGEAERIRAFTIAVEAFGRDRDFDPQSDPIVRVEAARLRRAIDLYYNGVGAGDPVEIEVPRGGYVPRFRYRGREHAIREQAIREHATRQREMREARERETAALPPAPRRHVRHAAAAAWLLLIAAALGGALLLRQPIPQTAALTPAPEPARPRSPFPQLLLDPVAPELAAVAPALATIRARLADALARFDDVEVMVDPAAAVLPAREPGAPNVYRLAVGGERGADGTPNVTLQLTDQDGAVVWSRGFAARGAQTGAAQDPAAAIDKLVHVAAPALAQPYGVIYARERVALARPGVDWRYRCLLDGIEYRRTLDTTRSDQHAEIRGCLERTVASDPTFPSAQAALAFVLMREFYAGESRDPKGLDDALRLALRAVELRPGSARARHVLMNILFARGSVAQALREGEQALALNPYDMTVLTGYGLRLAFAGRANEGLALLERAEKLSPVRPPTLEFAQFLVSYVLGDDARATHHAGMLTDEVHPFVLVARALVAMRAGDRPRAQAAIDRLFALYPHWRMSPRGEIERYVSAGEIVDRMIRDLSPVGFTAVN